MGSSRRAMGKIELLYLDCGTEYLKRPALRIVPFLALDALPIRLAAQELLFPRNPLARAVFPAPPVRARQNKVTASSETLNLVLRPLGPRRRYPLADDRCHRKLRLAVSQ